MYLLEFFEAQDELMNKDDSQVMCYTWIFHRYLIKFPTAMYFKMLKKINTVMGQKSRFSYELIMDE